MNRFLSCVCVFCLLFGTLTVPALAEEVEATPPAETSTPVTVPQPFQVEVTLIDGNPAPEVSGDPAIAGKNDLEAVTVLEEFNANAQSGVTGGSVSALDPSASERDGLPGVVEQVFGVYTPRTYTTSTYIDGELVAGSEIVPGLAGLDWPWLAGVGFFGLMLYCLFRLLGGIWK